MNPPKIFISATSGDLSSARQIAKEALLTINCHPVEQTNFEPDWRSVTDMLRGKIGDCQALIHLVGFRYGAEPEPASLPAGTPRRSYTQMEYHLARELGLRVYTFLLPETYPFDVPAKADTPEVTQLQAAHRALIQSSPHLYEKPANDLDLRTRLIALQEKVIGLEQEQTDVKQGLSRSHRVLLLVLVLILMLAALVTGELWLTNRHVETLPARVEDSIRKGYTVDAAKIRIQLEAASQKKRDEDITEANDLKLHPKWDDRQKLREEAEAAHKQRVSRVTEFAQEFAELAAAKDASPVLIEMGRIIETEGVDAALAYFETQRGDVMKRAQSRLAAARDAAHRDLQPMLKAAGLQVTKGQTDAARASYQDLLKLDPQWPEALDGYVGFLYHESARTMVHGLLSVAIVDANECLTQAQRYYDLDKDQPSAQRALMTAHEQMGDVLGIRRLKSDADLIIQHRQQSLALAEALFKANPLYSATPESANALRNLSLSHDRLGDSLNDRAVLGNAEAALQHYKISYEQRMKLLEAYPQSNLAARDVSLSLSYLGNFLYDHGNAEAALQYFTACQTLLEEIVKLDTKPIDDAGFNNATNARLMTANLHSLGDYYLKRAQPGDVEVALKHYMRSMELDEKLLAANPDSAQAVRDVSISMEKLGNCYRKRGQPGDMATALKHYTRSLEMTEKLLAANPDSGLAAADLSVCLQKLGDFLAERGQPGDVEAAVTHHTRELEIEEKLLAANPDSAGALSGLAMTLNKLGDDLAQRGEPGDPDAALKHFTRSLELREKLLAATPDSAKVVRDVVAYHLKLAGCRQQLGDKAGEEHHSRACYDLLQESIAKGMKFDSTVMQVHEELQARFGTK